MPDPKITFGTTEVRARLALSLFVAALAPLVVMDWVVLSVDLRHASAHAIEAIVIGSGVGGALAGMAIGWIMSGVVVRYADARVAEATSRLVELTHALAVERDRVARAMEASRLSTWELDIPSGVTHLSANWSVLMGDADCETTVPISDLLERVPEADQSPCWAALRAVLRGEAQLYDVEHRVRRNDGSTIWIRSRGAVSARDEDGRVRRMTGTNFDITARKSAELALQESEAKLRLITDNLPVVMVVYHDPELGLADVAPETWERIGRNLEQLSAGKEIVHDLVVRRAQGDERHFEVHLVPQRSAEGRLESVFVLEHDVTQRAMTSTDSRR